MIGGAETYLARIAPRMRALGVDIEICALERQGSLIGQLEASGIQVLSTRFQSKLRSDPASRAVDFVRSINDLRRIIRRGGYDVVHSYLFLADLAAVSAARLTNCKRIIVSRRSMHSAVHPSNPFLHALEQLVNMFSTELIANSRAVLKDADEHEVWLPSVRTVIYNGVDVEAYQPARPSSSGPLRLVTVGSLTPLKGQRYAIQAVATLRDSGITATLELVGTGPDEFMLRREASAAGLTDSVIFAGEQADPRPFLTRADVFVLPSRVEGFSNALLEAMASALPAVATDVGGNSEALIHGAGGRIVPPGQPTAIPTAIVGLANPRSNLPGMGQFNPPPRHIQSPLAPST